MRFTSRWAVLTGLFVLSLAPAAAPPAGLLGDPLPAGAVARMGTLCFRHTGQIYAARFSADGKTILSFGADDTFRVWDAATGRQVQSWRRVGLRFTSSSAVAFSRDGKHLAIGCWKYSEGESRYYFLLCDIPTGKERMRILFPKDSDWIDSVAFMSDGKQVAAGDSKGKINLWDVASCRKVGAIERERGGRVRSIAFSLDGRKLVADSYGLSVLSDVVTGKALHPLHDRGERPWYSYPTRSALAFTPDGTKIAVTQRDCTIRIWDTKSGKEIRRLKSFEPGEVGSSKQCGSILFSRDGKTMVADNIDGWIEVWDIETGKRRLRFRQYEYVSGLFPGPSLAISPDERILASWGGSHALRLWNVADGKEIHAAKSHGTTVHAVALSPDGRTLSTAGVYRQMGSWDAGTGASRWLTTPRQLVHAVAYAPFGKSIASIDHVSIGAALMRNGEPAEIAFRDTETGKLLRPRQFKDCDLLMALAATPDGRLLLFDSSGRIYAYDRKDGEQIVKLKKEGGNKEIEGFSWQFSVDGRRLMNWPDRDRYRDAERTQEAKIILCDTATGKHVTTVRVEQALILSLALSPDHRTIAAASEDGSLRLWEVSTGQERWRAEGFSRVCFSPDGRLLVAGGKSGEIVLYDMRLRRELCRTEGHRGEVTALAFAADGRTFASGSRDTTALVWSLEKVSRLAQVKVGPVPAVGEEAWAALAGDATKAHRAAASFVAEPEKAVRFLRDKVRPRPLDRKQAERWVADLDSDRHVTRQRASDELEALGEQAEPFLRKALDAKPSAEVRRRVVRLLRLLRNPVPPARTLQFLRAVEVLEDIGTAEARKVLEGFARGAPELRETREAKEALARSAR